MTALPSQRLRRQYILWLLVSYPLACALLWLTMRESSFFALAHLLVTGLIFWQLAVLRVGRVGKLIADDLDTVLDERQLAQRNAAYLDAYRIAAAVVLLGVIWIALGIDLGFWWVPTTYNEWNLIFWGLFIYLMTLPSAFLAWREPDRREDMEMVDA